MSPSPALSTFDGELQCAFLRYMRNLPSVRTRGLAIPLHYRYTEATMAASYLKGVDAFVYNALTKVGQPTLKHVLRVDKTRVYSPEHWEGECDWKPTFDALYLLDEKTTREFRRIHQQHEDHRNTREEAYSTLLSKMNGSCRHGELEWLTPNSRAYIPRSSSPYFAQFESKEHFG